MRIPRYLAATRRQSQDLLAAVDRKNLEAYKGYEEGAFVSVAKYGVEPLAVSDDVDVLEGAAPGQRTYDQSASAAVASVRVIRNWPVVIMVGSSRA